MECNEAQAKKLQVGGNVLGFKFYVFGSKLLFSMESAVASRSCTVGPLLSNAAVIIPWLSLAVVGCFHQQLTRLVGR